MLFFIFEQYKYVNAIVKESLRYYPILETASRTTNTDNFKLGDYYIPKNS